MAGGGLKGVFLAHAQVDYPEPVKSRYTSNSFQQHGGHGGRGGGGGGRGRGRGGNGSRRGGGSDSYSRHGGGNKQKARSEFERFGM